MKRGSIVWLLAGALLGATAALLLAPKSGMETRHTLTSAFRRRFRRGERDDSRKAPADLEVGTPT